MEHDSPRGRIRWVISSLDVPTSSKTRTSSAALILCTKSHFRVIQQIRKGTTGGVIGADGKLLIKDAAAVIMVNWEITIMLTVTSIACRMSSAILLLRAGD